jgi:hypothetical protein
MAPNRRSRTALRIVGALAVLVVCGVVAAFVILSRYVTTESADQTTAARAFADAREHLNGQTPLIEYREVPVMHRNASSPRQTLATINVLAYDADEEELKRVEIPAHLLELLTLGGRVRLANLGVFGDGRDRVTLEDLERHGPGLVLDVNGSSVLQVAVADLVLGRKARGSRVMIWTD